MLSLALAAILIIGVSTLMWSISGIMRVVAGLFHRSSRRWQPRARYGAFAARPIHPHEVAVIVAAHNEELVIKRTIDSAAALLPARNIFVASDGSTDRTAEIARASGANVLEVNPNRGKAGAITAAIEHFELARRFRAVLLLDADTHLDERYFETGLPLFSKRDVVAVAGRAESIFDPPSPRLMGRLLVAYRERLYVIVQYITKFGQAARHANVVSIVPGFASMYRTRVLDRIDIDAPNLTIEDFNMTFEIHAKQLGRIAFHPLAAVAYTQDPDTFADYTKQMRRWSLGFWQTVRRHRFRAGRFWSALGLYMFELVSGSVMMIALVPLAATVTAASVALAAGYDPGGVPSAIVTVVPPWALVVGILLPDFALTLFTAIVTRRPRYVLWGTTFLFFRLVDSIICLRTLALSFRPGATGVWSSPERRPLQSRA